MEVYTHQYFNIHFLWFWINVLFFSSINFFLWAVLFLHKGKKKRDDRYFSWKQSRIAAGEPWPLALCLGSQLCVQVECASICVQRPLQVRVFVCERHRVQISEEWMSQVIIYWSRTFYSNPSVDLWCFLWEQEIILFVCCVRSYQHVNIRHWHTGLKES